ncbi:DUF4287 domain-containing protein [Streptomyces sp. NBC_00046]|uniref:DUF4287 domain-containing protein n=1 Tax=Streptomyces sp. NBC_00046 TaxID=2975626 RepID=UPI003864D34E
MSSPLTKPMEIVDRLRSEHSLGHGHTDAPVGAHARPRQERPTRWAECAPGATGRSIPGSVESGALPSGGYPPRHFGSWPQRGAGQSRAKIPLKHRTS